jgi:hypothetical protein
MASFRGGMIARTAYVTGPSISISGASVLENASIGTTVATLSVVGGTGTYVFTLTDSAGGKFTTAGTNGTNLNTAAALDYETATSHNITISAAGTGGPYTRTLPIAVIDVDEIAPTITSPNTFSAPENSNYDHTLTANEAVTWSIFGGADAAQFSIVSGNVLRLLAQDFEAGTTRTVIVRATDAVGLTTNQTITATITDVVEGTPALTLTWVSGNTVLDPVFTLNFVAQIGDILTLEIDNNSDFSSLYDSDIHILTGTDVFNGTLNYAGIDTLGENTTYYARVKQDRGGVITYSNTVSKVIADVTGGVVTAFFPLDNSTLVDVNVELTATFNETITLGTGHIYLKKTSDNSIVEDWNVATEAGSGAGQVRVVGGNVLHLRPTAALPGGTPFYVVWDAGVVVDLFAHGNAAMSSTTAWSFTTLVTGGWTSPLDASTPALWWVDASNASTITKTGTAPNETVTQLNDLGTGAHNMTPNGTGPYYRASSLNGLPGLELTGLRNLRTAVFVRAQPAMLVMVWKQTATVPEDYAVLYYGDQGVGSVTCAIVSNKWGATAGNAAIYAGTAVSQGVTVALNTAYHSRIIFDGSSSSSVLNASNLTGVNPGTGEVIKLGLSLGAPAVGNQPNAIICEAFIIPYADHAAVLANAPADAANAAAYTLAKWGV